MSILGTPAVESCALTRFSAGLARALSDQNVDVTVIGDAASPNSSPEGPTSAAACAYLLNQSDVAIIQHEFGQRSDAGNLMDILEGVLVPSIVVVHDVPKYPTAQQCSMIEAIGAGATHLVVMSRAARENLGTGYSISRQKISTIPHGATVPTMSRLKRPSRPTILTWGWLSHGDGIERVIDVMASLQNVPGRPRYLVAGPTHPRAMAVNGDSYREDLIEQARRCGVADSVSFDPGSYDGSMLATLLQQCSVVVLPYDSAEQVTSGVLVESIAHGRPVIATDFPHATELLNGGAGAVVDHDDSAGLATALRRVVTQPRLAGSMAAEARRLAPEMAWPTVAKAYVRLAQHLLALQEARV
ncbi:glycosyl transferase family 1 [Mycolicibacterium sp. GF69]|nr:glycosyl transferase family 1 [Mycolicibacterium sp. GF69]